jgi:Abnormal spindle-like microcephaly-assoc'd, ASPM-SPD-2-Hydin
MKQILLTLAFSLILVAVPSPAQNIAPTLDSSFMGALGCNKLVQSDGYSAVGVTSCDSPAATTFSGADRWNWSGDVGSYYLSFCGYRNSDGTYYPFGDPILPLSGSSDCHWIAGGYDYVYHNGTFVPGGKGGKTWFSLIMETAKEDAFALGHSPTGPIIAKFRYSVFDDDWEVFEKAVVDGNVMIRDRVGNVYIANGNLITKYAAPAEKKPIKLLYTKTIPNASITAMVADQYLNVYVTGTTSGGIPVLYAPQPQPGGGVDSFLTVLSPQGDRIVYSTYLGGSGDDVATGVGGGRVMGTEKSYDWDGRHNCPGDTYANCSEFVFVSQFGPFRNSSLPAKQAFGSHKVGVTTTRKVLFKNLGDAPLNITGIQVSGAAYAQRNTCTAPVNPDKTCAITISFTPLSSGEQDGTLLVISDSLLSPQQVTLTGAGK